MKYSIMIVSILIGGLIFGLSTKESTYTWEKPKSIHHLRTFMCNDIEIVRLVDNSTFEYVESDCDSRYSNAPDSLLRIRTEHRTNNFGYKSIRKKALIARW